MILLQTLTVLIPFAFLLCGSIYLSFKTNFVQLRSMSYMFSLLWKSFFSPKQAKHTLKAHKALFTAMSTTIGISNIVGPLISIGMSGPESLLGYFLATIFGGAATFTEVTFAIKFRDPAPPKDRIGGPMHYLKEVFPSWISGMYALCGAVLMIFWSGAQSNALAVMLEPYAIAPFITGIVLAIITTFVLIGGVKRIGDLSERLVPVMFILYVGVMCWIIGYNISNLPATLRLIFNPFFSLKGLRDGFITGSLLNALRWGLAKSFTSNESGIGTATVPHSMVDKTDALDQGILSIVSVFSNGLLSLLSGIAVLITNAYTQYNTDSISIITNLFAEYLPIFGPFILLASTAMFIITTLIGNGFNGGNFFRYIFGCRGLYLYYGICAISIVGSALVPLNIIWQYVDLLVIPVVVPHIIGLALLVRKHPKVIVFKNKK